MKHNNLTMMVKPAPHKPSRFALWGRTFAFYALWFSVGFMTFVELTN